MPQQLTTCSFCFVLFFLSFSTLRPKINKISYWISHLFPEILRRQLLAGKDKRQKTNNNNNNALFHTPQTNCWQPDPWAVLSVYWSESTMPSTSQWTKRYHNQYFIFPEELFSYIDHEWQNGSYKWYCWNEHGTVQTLITQDDERLLYHKIDPKPIVHKEHKHIK